MDSENIFYILNIEEKNENIFIDIYNLYIIFINKFINNYKNESATRIYSKNKSYFFFIGILISIAPLQNLIKCSLIS